MLTVGSSTPRLYLARAFVRQDIGVGGEAESVEDAPNQLAAARDRRRITITVGTLAASDIFDDNAYSHDPRTQFFNWSLMDTAAWDYPADARGYTSGAAIEYHDGSWTTSAGAFLLPTEANGKQLEWRPWKSLGYVAQVQHDHDIDGHAGAVRLLGFVNHAPMGHYAEATEQPGVPDLGPTRRSSMKYGGAVSADQALGGGVGAFTRLGWNDGHTETWAFTEVDRTAAVGLAISGASWSRGDDTLGGALAVNGLSSEHERFLARGGTGIIVGDGALSYRPETIIEAYYRLRAITTLDVSPDVQWVENPGYNADRGPVWILGLRAHWAM